MKKFFIILFLLVCSIGITPVYSTVETQGIQIFCPIDDLDFSSNYVEFDELQICEAVGTILNSDIPETVVVGEGGDPTCSTDSKLENHTCIPIPIEPLEIKKSIKQQFDEIVAKKRTELKELFKKKFGDKWKEKWSLATGKIFKNMDEFFDFLNDLLNR